MNGRQDWLVAVTAGRWQCNGIREAMALGLKVVAVDADSEAEGFAQADHALNLPLDEVDAVIKALRAMNVRIAGAVSFASDAGMTLAAEIRQAFDLPGVRPDLCRRLLNKAEQRSLWAKHGVPGPAVEVHSDSGTALRGISSFGFPLIVKPADSSGSRGVSKLESSEDDVHEALARAFEFSKSGQILLEGYMQGTEFTVETFGVNGHHHVLAITEKKKVEGTRGTVARELATPDRPAHIVERIATAVLAAYEALGYRDGPGHAEVILQDTGQVGLVEVAGRGGGFMVFDRLVPAVSGVNIARLTAMQAVGLDPGPVHPRRDAAVLRFAPSRPGTLLGIEGLEAANAIPGVEAGAFVQPGQVFHRAQADGDRLGYILSRASTPAQAQRLANQAEQLIHFRFGGQS